MKLPVSLNTNPAGLAGAIAVRLRNKEHVELSCIGPTAIFIAGKALALARSFLWDDKIGIYEIPRLHETKGDKDNRDITGVIIDLERYVFS